MQQIAIFAPMEFGICLLSHVPCRKEPSDKSELVTQLLFGEHYTVLEVLPKWIKIKIFHDSYEAWICPKQHTPISDFFFQQLSQSSLLYCTELVQVIQNKEQLFPIVLGSTLPFLKEDKIKIENNEFEYHGSVSNPQIKPDKNKIIQDAFMYLGAPYLWGGRSPFGIDCSGFTQMVYRLNNFNIPRDASQQIDLGTHYSFIEEAQAGDLAFFDNEEGRIIHVGILLQDQKIIHASGQVRIDKLDHHGIFNEQIGKYTHKLRIIKKLI